MSNTQASEAAPLEAVPQKQIRALYDKDTITVYQAYSAAIAIPAVKEQNLCASPEFKVGRMTWIKPSWCWMMYRSAYSHKDAHQTHILALSMSHAHFTHLLSLALVPHGRKPPLTPAEKSQYPVRVQWDPERSPTLEVLPYRSIQIGISGAISEIWAREWVQRIEDVTARARELKRVLDQEVGAGLGVEELVRRGLVPREVVYEVEEEEVRKRLGM